ncbi:hypothetical protein AB751O23_AJ_00200 [Chlamydiales bacterium SCGC AB-751-O23]|jgi:hypothetical protein|nr:hypothetical protein AB751O23_AJ_00200 [Chlamydiales bacterium SCGC AB-751-O23]
MKKLYLVFLLGCLAFNAVNAQEREEKPEKIGNEADGLRFSMGGYSTVGSKFTSKGVKGQKLAYKDLDVKFSSRGNTFNEEDEHYFSIGAEYTNLRWSENPNISQTAFADLVVAGGVSTDLSSDWTLRMMLLGALDINNPSLTKSTRYNGYTWGIFHYDPELAFHVGAMAYSEIKRYGVLPVVGITYVDLYNGWKVKAIFPLKASVSYRLAPEWIFALKHRYKNFRHRGKSVNSGDRRIFDYRSHGGELALKYEPNSYSQISGFLGIHGNAEYRIFDKDGRHRQAYKTKSGVYYGFSGFLVF